MHVNWTVSYHIKSIRSVCRPNSILILQALSWRVKSNFTLIFISIAHNTKWTDVICNSKLVVLSDRGNFEIFKQLLSNIGMDTSTIKTCGIWSAAILVFQVWFTLSFDILVLHFLDVAVNLLHRRPSLRKRFFNSRLNYDFRLINRSLSSIIRLSWFKSVKQIVLFSFSWIGWLWLSVVPIHCISLVLCHYQRWLILFVLRFLKL